MLRKKRGFGHEDDGFPEVYHTHFPYDGVGFMKIMPKMPRWFEQFDGLVYIYRNPFDTMISYHKFIFNLACSPESSRYTLPGCPERLHQKSERY